MQRFWPKQSHHIPMSKRNHQQTRKSSKYYTTNVQWKSGNVEYRPGGLGIEGWCKSIVLTALSSTKGAQDKDQKVSIKTSKTRGGIEEANESEWGAPSFTHPKAKTNRIGILSDCRNSNRQLKRKPYPMLKIQEMLLNLDGFQYAMSLDLNMSYYHIGQNLCI